MDPCRHPNTIIQDIMTANGIQDLEKESFLNPSYNEICNTCEQFPDMSIAVDRVHEAIKNKERILIWGDFDVDGLTATAIMVRTLQFLGAKPEWHLPDRRTESHGFK